MGNIIYFLSTKHPPLYETAQCFVLDVKNDLREYNLPYPQSAFTHNLGTSLMKTNDWQRIVQSEHIIDYF